MFAQTAMASWTTCWRRSRRLGPDSHVLASPSTCPLSSSTGLLSSSTGSVPFSWVRCCLADPRDGNPAVYAASLSQPSWFSRGASVRRGAAGETEDVAEDRSGRAKQARTAAQQFHPLYIKTQDNVCFTFQTRSGPPRRPDAPGGGREGSGPVVWSHANTGCHTQPQCTDQGTERTSRERKDEAEDEV